MKKTKQKKANKSNKSLITGLIVVIVLLLISMFFMFFKTEKLDRDCVSDRCKCVAWDSPLFCQEGWELKDGYCYREGQVTNGRRPCSKYDCGDYFVEIKY